MQIQLPDELLLVDTKGGIMVLPGSGVGAGVEIPVRITNSAVGPRLGLQLRGQLARSSRRHGVQCISPSLLGPAERERGEKKKEEKKRKLETSERIRTGSPSHSARALFSGAATGLEGPLFLSTTSGTLI